MSDPYGNKNIHDAQIEQNDSEAGQVGMDDMQTYAPYSEHLNDPLATNDDDLSSDADGHAVILKLQAEIKAMKEQLLRTMAENENTRKRAIREREDAAKYAVSSFARDLVSVADNLRRALSAVPEELLGLQPQIKNLVDGIEATERDLLRSFEKNGIQKLDPINTPFDPNFHEVMFEAPITDKPNGLIIQVIEPGYTLNGRILRPARVGVAKNEHTTETGHTINTQV